MGFADGCGDAASRPTSAKFGRKFRTPVLIATGDGDADSDALHTALVGNFAGNRAAITCGPAGSGFHWFAMDAGVTTLSGKRIEAGRVISSADSPSTVITFGAGFPSAPVVFVHPLHSSGMVEVLRVSTTELEISAGPQVELSWIAMEPGTYQAGDMSWSAGVFTTSAGACDPTSIVWDGGFNYYQSEDPYCRMPMASSAEVPTGALVKPLRIWSGFHGTENGWARVASLTADQLTVQLGWYSPTPTFQPKQLSYLVFSSPN
jgi:hypothetical protein